MAPNPERAANNPEDWFEELFKFPPDRNDPEGYEVFYSKSEVEPGNYKEYHAPEAGHRIESSRRDFRKYSLARLHQLEADFKGDTSALRKLREDFESLPEGVVIARSSSPLPGADSCYWIETQTSDLTVEVTTRALARIAERLLQRDGAPTALVNSASSPILQPLPNGATLEPAVPTNKRRGRKRRIPVNKERLRGYRDKLKMTQAEFAHECSVDTNTIQRGEKGEGWESDTYDDVASGITRMLKEAGFGETVTEEDLQQPQNPQMPQ